MLIYTISKENDLLNIPDWVEWLELRLDLDSSLIDYLHNLTKYKLIITDRWNGEGGKSQKNLSEKLSFYQTLANYPNLYFDIEIELYANQEEMLLDNKRIILSYHNFASLELADLKKKLFQAQALNPFFIKIAQSCFTFQEVQKLHQLVKDFDRDVLWVVMGDYGKIQRLLHPYLESIGSFIAQDGEETVVGQLNISDVEKYQHLLASKPFKWGGIIGGKQVNSSLGLDYYNNYFRNNDIEAAYLPFNLKESDLPYFFALIKSSPLLEKNCYGFSLTMPFKQTIPELFHQASISNLLIYNSRPQFYNTDFDALVKIKEYLQAFSLKSVLVYGSGSMAEMALSVFADFELFLAARNKTKLYKLKDRRNNIEIIDQLKPELYFDLLINCSPLGMRGESFSQETGLVKFKYVIDLPYSESVIPLQNEVETGKYISGKEFWSYQSERQLQLFKERIEND